MDLMDDGIEILDDAECRRLLESTSVGRVVVTLGGLAAVFPVNYGVVGGDIVFFTGTGTKLAAAAKDNLVTFQIDRFDLLDESGWSVQVIGVASFGGPGLRLRAEAIGVYPWAGGDRHHLVRVRPDVVTGRRISTGRRPAAMPAPAPVSTPAASKPGPSMPAPPAQTAAPPQPLTDG